MAQKKSAAGAALKFGGKLQTLPDDLAGSFRHRQAKIADMRRWAKYQLGLNDPAFNWISWAEAVANQLLWTKPGLYYSESWTGQFKTRNWLACDPQSIICGGYRSYLFKAAGLCPDHIYEQIQLGVERAKRRKHRKLNSTQEARLLQLDKETRLKLRLRSLGAYDATKVDLGCEADARRNAHKRAQRAAKRSAGGNAPGRPKKAPSEEELKALGISRATWFRMRLKHGTDPSLYLQWEQCRNIVSHSGKPHEARPPRPSAERGRSKAGSLKPAIISPADRGGIVAGLSEGLEAALARLGANVQKKL
jgi:hypothetical protein